LVNGATEPTTRVSISAQTKSDRTAKHGAGTSQFNEHNKSNMAQQNQIGSFKRTADIGQTSETNQSGSRVQD
jgi:hypothetical protein